MNKNDQVSPVFILGVPRSGTTLLRVLLDSHSSIAGAPETPWITGGYSKRSLRELIEFLDEDEFGPVTNLSGVEAGTLVNAGRLFLNEIFKAYLISRNKQHLVLKTPDDIENLEFLLRTYPDAKYIYIHRDGRDVACSTFRQKGIGFGTELGDYGDLSIESALKRWCEWDRRVRSIFSDAKPGCLNISYENLVQDPERVLSEITAFVGVSYEPAMTNYAGLDHEYPEWEAGSADVSGKAGIDTGSIGQWRRRIPKSDWASIDERYGDYFKLLGYQRCRETSEFRSWEADGLVAAQSGKDGEIIVPPVRGAFNLKNQSDEYFGPHRSGWAYAVKSLLAAHDPEKIYLNTFVEKSFVWDPGSASAITEPWIGFIHIPPGVPDWFMGFQSNDSMFSMPQWQDSMPHCRGLFTLSEYHKKNLENKLNVPVNALLHPAEIPELQWSWERYERNPRKSIVQVGWWLRVLHAIFELPDTGMDKIFLRSRSEEWFDALMQCEREIRKKKGLFIDSMYDTTKVVNHLSNIEYDRLLSENIVFVNFYDTSANNAIIECIARGTPIIVNPLEAVVEYLGKDYPLYYQSLDEAADKARNPELLIAANKHLMEIQKGKKLSSERFLESLLGSEILLGLQESRELGASPGDSQIKLDANAGCVELRNETALQKNSKGETCFRNGDLENAERYFLEAIKLDEEFSDGYNNLGVLYWQNNDPANALTYLSRGLRLNCENPDLITNTGQILETLGKTDDAIALYEGYLARNPDHHVIGGMLDELKRQGTESKCGHDEAPSSGGLNAEGEKAFLDGDYARAESIFTRAYEQDPGNIEVCNNLIVLNWKTGNTESSVHYLAEAVETDPYNKDVVVNGSEILNALGKREEAAALLKGYLDRNPGESEISELFSTVGGKEIDLEPSYADAFSRRYVELHEYSSGDDSSSAPRITVVIPLLEGAEYAEQTVLSVLGQRYPNLELIVIDCGGGDGTSEIVNRYRNQLIYSRSGPNPGCYGAIKEGLSQSTGDIMTWLSSDDMLHPGALDKVASVFSQCSHVDWLTGVPNTVDEKGKEKWTYPRTPVFCRDNFLRKQWEFPHPIQQQGTFWRRALWHEAGAYLEADLKKAGDLELWARFFRFSALFTLGEKLGAVRNKPVKDEEKSRTLLCQEVDSILEREIAVSMSDTRPIIPPMPPLALGSHTWYDGMLGDTPQHSRSSMVRMFDTDPESSGQDNACLINHAEATVSGDSGRVVIATSIAPKAIERQKRAIESWIELGFEVISLNVQKEIDVLHHDFPGVSFVQAKRHGGKVAGKPYVYIEDMLGILENTGSKTVGIVNSDIIIRATRDITEQIASQAHQSFIYGSRIDINRIDGDGELYHRGVDYFFFDVSLVEKLPPANFMLGMPWWDWWLPISAIRLGYAAKRVDSPFGYHVRHELNYSNNHMMRFADEFSRVFEGEGFVSIYRECIRRGGSVDKHRMTIMADLAAEYLAINSRRISFETCDAPREDQTGEISASPKITAIISTYSSENHIGDCLSDLTSQSIAGQIEIIVIDAASPQNEHLVVERFQEKYPNIRYHRTRQRIGIYEAWNVAAKMARGEYLITCSTNDRLRHDACEILSRTLDENRNLALVYGNSFLSKVPYESFNNPTLFGVYVWPEYSYESLTDRCLVGPHPMWRRSVHEEVGYFDETLVALGDQEFWLRLGERYEMRALPDFTGLYYVSESSITGDIDLAQTETDRIHAKYRWRYRYGQWYNRRSAGDAETVQCKEQSLVHIIVVAERAIGSQLADSLDSVAGQSYSNWHLSVVSREACPDPLFDQETCLDWAHFREDERLGQVLDDVANNLDSDWICVINSGDRLDPAFLADSQKYVSKHPDWKIVYCDDDRVDQGDELFDPRFKPDFNLELLLGTDYIGNACLVSKFALLHAGGFGQLDKIIPFDLILRVHDLFGIRAIGHLADIRFHRLEKHPIENQLQVDEQRKQAIAAHLERRGESASVESAVLPGTFMLNYRVEEWPKISVLVVATGKSDHLQTCLQKLLSKTDYPDFELCVLDRTQEGSDENAYLARLSAADQRVTLAKGKASNEGTELNRLALEAKGEYLLWLNEEVSPVHPNWLKRLVEQGYRDSVGAVGARVVNRRRTVVSGGIILGIGARGVGARCHDGIHITSPGYMGRAQLAQEMSSVPGLCMLVRSELFNKLGGYDERLEVSLYRDIDLCMRIRKSQQTVIWTPFSTVIYLGEGAYVDGRAHDERKLEKQISYLQERWLPELAADAAHNRNMSVHRTDFSPEIHTVRNWDPEIDDKPRVLSFGSGSLGSWQYRVKQPLDFLHRQGTLQRTHTEFVGKKQIVLPSVIDIERLKPDTLLMHNTMHDDLIRAMETYKRINKTFIVFGQDDLMTELPAKNPFSRTIYKDIKRRVRQCLELADRVVVTTEPLAHALSGVANDIIVVPNYLDSEIWGSLKSRNSQTGKPRVGWAGAQQHLGDLELLEQVVRETSDEVDWVFFGMCPGFLQQYVREIHRPVSFEAYPEKLASLNLDLALAPLEHNRFNECKSNLRILEYGIMGWPVIATDIIPYRNAPVCRVANQARAWIGAIRERVHDMNACRQEGAALLEWVRGNWLLENKGEEWLKAVSTQENPCDCATLKTDRLAFEKSAVR